MTLLSTTLIVVIVSMWALCVIARGYGHNVYDEYQDILYYKNDYNDGIQITDDAVEDIGDLWLDDNIWDEIEKIKLFDDVWILKKCVNYEADSMCACQSYAVYGNFGLYSCDVHISSSKYNDLSDNKYIDEYYADEDQMGNFNVGDDVLIGNLKKKRKRIPNILMRIVCWVLGEYGQFCTGKPIDIDDDDDDEEELIALSPMEILQTLWSVIEKQGQDLS
eukprot:399470_1